MKRVLFFLIFFTLCVEVARAEFCSQQPWDFTNKTLLTTAIVADVIDWRQTQQIVKHPNRWNEKNPFLGDHPSMATLNRYAVVSIASMVLISDCLPSGWRKMYLGSVTAFELYMVQRNYGLGIRFGF